MSALNLASGSKRGLLCSKASKNPNRLVANTETLTERYGMFTAQPFQRGFGTTIGNSLRRVLLELH